MEWGVIVNDMEVWKMQTNFELDEKVRQLAHDVFNNTKGATEGVDPFWSHGEIDLLRTTFSFLIGLYEKSEQTMYTVVEIIKKVGAQHMTELIICENALCGLRQIASESVDVCVTSPPYYGLRDYGNPKQIGLEDSPELYIKRLVEVFCEVRRVLKNDGTLWIVIGDSYAGSGKGAATHPNNAKLYKQGSNRGMLGSVKTAKMKTPSCKPKDLIGIPWMLAFALRDDGWYLRQDIIWHKSNPMPESVKDRCTKSHEYLFMLSKSPNYYYDYKIMQEPSVTLKDKAKTYDGRYGGKKYTDYPDEFSRTKSENLYNYTGFRNKRSVWTVSVKPFKGAHFATFPPDLIRPCVLAGSRIGGTVLDPFLGSGTSAIVALEERRGYIGIELNAKYVELAKKRIKETMINYKFAL